MSWLMAWLHQNENYTDDANAKGNIADGAFVCGRANRVDSQQQARMLKVAYNGEAEKGMEE